MGFAAATASFVLGRRPAKMRAQGLVVAYTAMPIAVIWKGSELLAW
jgi:hypothetical protein